MSTVGVASIACLALSGCCGTRLAELPHPVIVLTVTEANCTRMYAVDGDGQGWKSDGCTSDLVETRRLSATEQVEVADSIGGLLAQSGGRRCQTMLDDASLEVSFARIDDRGSSSVGACSAADGSLKPPADVAAASIRSLITGVRVEPCTDASCSHLVGCGDGVANGTDLCDGWSWRSGLSSKCADYGLGAGEVLCRADCKADFAYCERTDYCTTNGLRSNGACDPCALLTPTDPRHEPDPECAALCGADGVCADSWYPLVGDFACHAVGLVDPDCTCGNGSLDAGACVPPELGGCTELCDGSAQLVGSCIDWGLGAGTLACRTDCRPDFSGCNAPLSPGN